MISNGAENILQQKVISILDGDRDNSKLNQIKLNFFLDTLYIISSAVGLYIEFLENSKHFISYGSYGATTGVDIIYDQLARERNISHWN